MKQIRVGLGKKANSSVQTATNIWFQRLSNSLFRSYDKFSSLNVFSFVVYWLFFESQKKENLDCSLKLKLIIFFNEHILIWSWINETENYPLQTFDLAYSVRHFYKLHKEHILRSSFLTFLVKNKHQFCNLCLEIFVMTGGIYRVTH